MGEIRAIVLASPGSEGEPLFERFLCQVVMEKTVLSFVCVSYHF